MKKRILLNPLIGMTALVAATPVMAGCSTTTKETSVLTAVLGRTYKVGDVLAKDDITLKLDNKAVEASDWSLYLNNKEVQTYRFEDTTKVEFEAKCNGKSLWFNVTAEKGEDEEYEKDNTYLCEQRFINTEVNAISHNVRFELKNELEEGQKLVAKITEDPEMTTKILTDQTVDLSPFTFGETFYVPVQAKTAYVKKTVITKFSVEISCVNDSTNSTVWTNKYADLYIKFIAVNALPGIDYRLQRIDIDQMDNAYINTRYTQYEGQYKFPLQIELREQLASAGYKNLHAIVYNQRGYNPNGTQNDAFWVDMVTPDDGGNYWNWIRQWSSERTVHNFDWNYQANDWYIIHDLTERAWNISYTMLMEFAGDVSQMQQGSYVTFDFVLYQANNDQSKIYWYENFSGCKMKFIPMGADNK